jgi:hypothetical protein
VQTFCLPATNAPYCTVSFSATIGASVDIQPFGIGATIRGSFTAGVGANVYGTGTFQCNVRVTARAWLKPCRGVRRFGIFPCTNFLGLPDICIGWRNVWVPSKARRRLTPARLPSCRR